MKLMITLLISLVIISGCQKFEKPVAKITPKTYTTSALTTTSIATTTVFDCKSCQEGYICRNNGCIKVEYSNTGSGSSGSY